MNKILVSLIVAMIFLSGIKCEFKNEEDKTGRKETEGKIEEEKWEVYKLTAYCPCEKCCGKSDGITASGTKATEGRTIAVDTEIIPYGTEVLVEGLGKFIAEDCGGVIKGNRIDIYFNSHEDALEFGVQERKVKILKKEGS